MDITTLLLFTVPFLFAKKKPDNTGFDDTVVNGPFKLGLDNKITASINGTNFEIIWPNLLIDLRPIVSFLNFYYRPTLSEQIAALSPSVENTPAGWESNPFDMYNVKNANNLAAANVLMAVHGRPPLFPSIITIFKDNYWFKKNGLYFFDVPAVVVKKEYKPNPTAPKIYTLEPSSPYRFKDNRVYYHVPFVMTPFLVDFLNDLMNQKTPAEMLVIFNSRPFTDVEQSLIELASEIKGFNIKTTNGRKIVPSWQSISRPLSQLNQSPSAPGQNTGTPGNVSPRLGYVNF